MLLEESITYVEATKFGGNDRVISLSFPWGFIKVNAPSLPPVTLKTFFVRFSFSPFCVKTTIPSSPFVCLWFVSFFTEACFSSCKNITKLYSLVRRPHSVTTKVLKKCLIPTMILTTLKKVKKLIQTLIS